MKAKADHAGQSTKQSTATRKDADINQSLH